MKKQIKNLYLDIFFNINWIEQFDRENISSEMIQKNYIYNPNILKRQMPIAEIANGIAHKYILETIKEKNETALILEDDTVFKEGLINNLYYILKNISDDWEIICLGGPTYDENFPDKTLSGSTRTHFCSNEIILHKPNTPAPHTMSCILINKKGVDKLLDSKYMNPLSCPIDHAVWLSGIDKNVIMYWSQPWISFEGSKSDNFEPSLNKNF
jgi:GR25 family glycosyltransferase involved in LPS biosynthesis